MKLVQLRLRESTMFWNLGPISLQRGKANTSPLIDTERLTPAQKSVINRSVVAEEIVLFDHDGNKIDGVLDNINVVYGNSISVEDVQEDEDAMPEVVSVTVDNEEEPEEEEEVEVNEDDMKNAEILLNNHWSTVKKTVQGLEKSSQSLSLIHAALAVELDGKKRQGVISALQDALMEQ